MFSKNLDKFRNTAVSNNLITLKYLLHFQISKIQKEKLQTKYSKHFKKS